jgi:hypothetical protein
MGRTAQLTFRCCIISVLFSSKRRLFHNSTLFGSCIIHILNTGCAKIFKKSSGAKGLRNFKGTGSEGMDWIHLGEERELWLVLLCLVESLGFLKWGKFLDFLSKYCTVCLRMNCFQ